MKTITRIGILTALASLISAQQLHAQSSVFTYQGQLVDGGFYANGFYDLEFTLYNDAVSGSALGVLTNTATEVADGMFTVSLDFGSGVFDGSDLWLEIGAVTNGAGTFNVLSPRQPITAIPYAVLSAGVSGTVEASQLAGTISASNIGANSITSVMLADGAVGTDQLATGSVFDGSFVGDAGLLTNLDLTTSSDGSIQPRGKFYINSSPTVGNSQSSVISVDVNGDGWPDLISAAGINLMVLTNSGSGGFALSSTNIVGISESVTSADVNGDGWPDLISANYWGDYLTVLTNNGSGGFTLSSSPGVGLGSGPRSVASADVNGDGWPDLISANSFSNNLTVLTNNGGGIFSFSSSPNVEIFPYSVTSADVNGDGWSDLISANYYDHTLTVLTNNGSGDFMLSYSYLAGMGPYSVTSADVNGDGWPDLISANYDSDDLIVLTNNGSGSFLASSAPKVGANPWSVISADVNGDGWPDLISANYNDFNLTVLTNNGSGGFTLSSSPGVGGLPRSVTSADVNGDGRVDLISANYDSDDLTVLFNGLTFSGIFSGNGSNLSYLNASELASGTVDDARLSANVAKLNASQTFTGVNTFNNAANAFTGSFNGDGGGLTGISSLDAADGTPSQAVYVDNEGEVGIGTPNPGAAVTISRPVQASAYQLELRNEGSIQSPNFDGIQFTQGSDGGTELASIKVKYVNSGNPDMSFSVRGIADALFIHGAYNSQNGNVGIGTTSPSQKLHVVGNIYATGTITPSSDRNLKKNFNPVNALEVLERVSSLPIQQWTYKAEADAVRHVGPMAQDFHAAFGYGANDITIATVDADGVALAAIQGLNQKLEFRSQRSEDRSQLLEEKLEQKEAEITELNARLTTLESIIANLNTEGN